MKIESFYSNLAPVIINTQTADYNKVASITQNTLDNYRSYKTLMDDLSIRCAEHFPEFTKEEMRTIRLISSFTDVKTISKRYAELLTIKEKIATIFGCYFASCSIGSLFALVPFWGLATAEVGLLLAQILLAIFSNISLKGAFIYVFTLAKALLPFVPYYLITVCTIGALIGTIYMFHDHQHHLLKNFTTSLENASKFTKQHLTRLIQQLETNKNSVDLHRKPFYEQLIKKLNRYKELMELRVTGKILRDATQNQMHSDTERLVLKYLNG